MEYRRFLGSIFLVVFLLATHAVRGGNGDAVDDLKNQMMTEANDFNLTIDESQIEIAESSGEGNDGIFAFYSFADELDATDEEIAAGDVYTGFQCMETEKLNGCFKVRLTYANETLVTFALVDKEGTIVATSKMIVDPSDISTIEVVRRGLLDRIRLRLNRKKIIRIIRIIIKIILWLSG